MEQQTSLSEQINLVDSVVSVVSPTLYTPPPAPVYNSFTLVFNEVYSLGDSEAALLQQL